MARFKGEGGFAFALCTWFRRSTPLPPSTRPILSLPAKWRSLGGGGGRGSLEGTREGGQAPHMLQSTSIKKSNLLMDQSKYTCTTPRPSDSVAIDGASSHLSRMSDLASSSEDEDRLYTQPEVIIVEGGSKRKEGSIYERPDHLLGGGSDSHKRKKGIMQLLQRRGCITRIIILLKNIRLCCLPLRMKRIVDLKLMRD